MSQGKLIVSRYRLGERIGSGGMGHVYKAEDTFTDTIVALKHLHPELVNNSPDMIKRFKREGQLLRNLDHPNIVKLLDAVQEGVEDHYLVMEYISGGSLREVMDQPEAIPVERVLSIALDLADALTRAHRLEIIHRDLKPANILLARDGTPRLTDFGIARMAGMDTITDSNEMVGTVAYMSPETIIGEPVDVRADIWSFGILIYEMLTGIRPFGIGLQVIAAILNTPVPDPNLLRDDLPDALVDLLYRMLEKNPQARIPSMRTVGAELESILQGRGSAFMVGANGSTADGSAFVAQPITRGSREGLPVLSTPFVGRESELDAIQSLIFDCRMVTLAGPGGMGKTRLALEATDRVLESFNDGAYFVPLAPVADIEDVIPTIANNIGLSLTGNRPALDQLIGALQNRKMLLTIDNLEHLLAASDMLASLLDRAPGVRLLVTSRERLRLSTECIYEVKGMLSPQTGDDQVFEDFEAVTLFMTYARRVQPGYILEEADREAVVRICQKLEGMPLGLELAAAWTRALSPAEIADELDADIDFLSSSLADVTERHRSMRAVFEYSWKLLSEREQDALARLAVFRGGATRDAARAVTDASLAVLVALVDKSLVQRNPASGRFQLHEMVREYAEDMLRESGAYDETRLAHSQYFARYLAHHERPLTGHQQGPTLQLLMADIDNIRAAWDWAVTHRLFDILNEAAHPLFAFYWLRDWASEGIQMFERAKQAAESSPDASTLVLGRLLVYTGAMYKHGWYIPDAHDPIHRGVELLREAGDTHALAHAIAQLAHLMTWEAQDDIAQVLPVAEEAIRLFEGIDDPQWETFARHVTGSVLHLMGRHEEGKAINEYNLALRREHGDRAGEGYTLNTMAVFERVAFEDYESARIYGQESLAVFQEVDNRQGIIYSYNNLAAGLGFAGQFEESIKMMQDVVAMCRKDNMTANMSGALANLGFAHWMNGDLDEAEQLGREALEIAERESLPGETFGACDLLARVLQEKGEFDEAREIGERGLPYSGYNFASPNRILYSLGVVAVEQGRLEDARQHFHDALARGWQERLPYLIYDALYRATWLIEAEGNIVRAVELLSYLLSVPTLPAFTRWRADGRLMELVKALDAAEVDAARSRGQGYDLEGIVAEVLAEDLALS